MYTEADFIFGFVPESVRAEVQRKAEEAYKEHQAKLEAQISLCKVKHIPVFAPASGYCCYCGADVYARLTVEDAGKRLVTGCQNCNRTFVD